MTQPRPQTATSPPAPLRRRGVKDRTIIGMGCVCRISPHPRPLSRYVVEGCRTKTHPHPLLAPQGGETSSGGEKDNTGRPVGRPYTPMILKWGLFEVLALTPPALPCGAGRISPNLELL